MTSRLALTAAACLLAGSAAFAQRPPAPPHGPMPPPHGAIAFQAEMVATGRVQQWLINPNGEADGLLLSDGTQVAFPPHLSAAMMQMLRPGDTVQVSGWRAPSVPVVRAQTIGANGRSVTDQPPMPGMAPPPLRDPGTLVAMSAGGRIERLLYTDRGDVHGVVLADKTIVRFPPHIGAMAPAIQRGLCRTLSISAPAGACIASPTSAETNITVPMRCGSQASVPAMKTIRNGPTPPWMSGAKKTSASRARRLRREGAVVVMAGRCEGSGSGRRRRRRRHHHRRGGRHGT
ncbi:hypothetical protein, partial [Variovorax sp. Varisp62]|uniref:hypothetical protein n=1 Tax=Variovorax sp. Varisp62 TaxID=3243049 RepID=UPI0039B4FC02